MFSTEEMKHLVSERFIDDLISTPWDQIASMPDDVNDALSEWTNNFSLILEKHAPLRQRMVTEKYFPWLTTEFKKVTHVRDKLKKTAVKTESEILMSAYRQVRNKVNKNECFSKEGIFFF